MRLSEVLQNRDKVLSYDQYDKLVTEHLQSTFFISCRPDSWDFQNAANATEAQVKNWIHRFRTIRTYEKQHGLDPTPETIVTQYVTPDNQDEPDWPAELQPYKGKVSGGILEAFLTHKVDLPCA